MAKSSNGNLFIKGKKTVIESNHNFIYEKIIYAIYPRLAYVIDSKILESSKFLEDSISTVTTDNVRYLISLELVQAPKEWIDDNDFKEWNGKPEKKTKKSK